MLEELSLHILDIAMNSLSAGTRTLSIWVDENEKADRLVIQVADDGCGMTEELLAEVLGKRSTTKRSRKKNIGLGLALLQQTAEMCDGSFQVRSAPGEGTTVTATMQHSHPDRPPLGDLSTTVLTLCVSHPDVVIQFRYDFNDEEITFSSAELQPKDPQSMNLEELKKLKEKAQHQIALRESQKKYRVVVSMGTSGIAAGARDVMKTMLDEIEKRGLDDVEVRVTGEVGLENVEPVIRIEEQDGDQTTYTKLDADKAKQIVAEHLNKGHKVDNLAVGKEKTPE